MSLELRELPLREVGIAQVQPLGRHEAEHRVAQELQPLVVFGLPLLVGERAVREGQLQ
jgi:hypothetical protein